LSDKVRTVPGPKHVVVQALLEYFIKLDVPKGCEVRLEREKKVQVEGQTYYIDVAVTYYKPGREKKVVYYEVQKDLNLPMFKKKMEVLNSLGEIIDLNKVPDSIAGCVEYLRDRVILPNFKRGG